MTDRELMEAALAEARQAAALGEVPVGAVVARQGQIVASAHNLRETKKNATHHAELLAIDAACRALGGWRLWECELFVTLEPCPMCAGAILNSRLRRVVYGAADPKAGCCGSVVDLFALPFNHRPRVESGLCAEESGALLAEFFARLRAGRAGAPRWRPPVGQKAAPAPGETSPAKADTRQDEEG
jgi:tRNA(adenine34) deaminase